MLNEKDGLFRRPYLHGKAKKKFILHIQKPYRGKEHDQAAMTLCDSINKNKEVAGLLSIVEGDASTDGYVYSSQFVFSVLCFTKTLLINTNRFVDLKIKEKGILRKTIFNEIVVTNSALKGRIDKLPLDTTAKDIFSCFKGKGLYFYNSTTKKYNLNGVYINHHKIYRIISILEKVGSDSGTYEVIQNAIKEIDEVLNIMLNEEGGLFYNGTINSAYDSDDSFCSYAIEKFNKAKEEATKEAEAMADKVLMACDPELVGLVDELASYAVLTHKYARTLTSSINDALIRDAFKEAGFVKYEKYQQVTIQGKRLRNIYYDPLRFNGEPSLWQLGFYLNKSVGVNHKVGEAEAMADNTQTLTLSRPKQQENKLLTVGNKKAYTVGKGDYQHRNGVIKEEKKEMGNTHTNPFDIEDKDILSDLEDLLNNVVDNPDTVDSIVNYLAKDALAAHFISEMIGCGEISDEESLIEKLNKANTLSKRIINAGKENVHANECERKIFNYLNVAYPKPVFGKECEEYNIHQFQRSFWEAGYKIKNILAEAKAEAEEEKEEVITHDAVQEHAEEDCEAYPADLEELQKLLEERRKKEAELDAEIKQAEEEARRKELVEQLLAADNRIKEKEERLAQLRKK